MKPFFFPILIETSTCLFAGVRAVLLFAYDFSFSIIVCGGTYDLTAKRLIN